MDGQARTAQQNIEMVARLEQEALEQRSPQDRIGDAIADFAGSMTFVIAQLVGFAVYASLNSGLIPFVKPWDPYPYILLALLVSLEGVMLSTFVLMKQNRMSRRADQRDHLNLQIDLLAEKEITKMLQLQQLICARLGIKEAQSDSEVVELSQHTAVQDLAKELEEKIPG
jgi:uncharacterized membrane protein